ncbi:acyl-CoA dehydrogenase family protein [Massilia rhizosphaerae]|uniref:acyl-CoA dehydrogenase family protein n=1 Tax=Massilia rhizosphaerae TaxID=2784389 RepID=UPI0018DEC845|nr:acyl-CoA dehydrogenase [Massilia rhizosphaerae]
MTSTSTSAVLRDIVFDGNYERVHEDIRAVLFDPAFDPHAGLTLEQAGRVSYARSRLVHGRLEEPLAFLRNPQRLFALAEWPSLVDVACFSLLMVHYNLCLGTVFDHGIDRPELAGYVDELNSLRAFGPYMATELGYGNNVAALQTEAVYEHATRSFILRTPSPQAQKYMSYSGFTDIPKIAVVMARLKVDDADCGVFPFIVRMSTEQGLCDGIRALPCPEKPVQGLDNGLTAFDGVRLPLHSMLPGRSARITDDGRFEPLVGNARSRFLRAMSRIVPGRLCVSSSAVGMGRASVYIALRHAAQRLTNAPGTNAMPVIEYRSHQLATFGALAKAYAITLMVNQVKRDYLAQLQEPSADVLNMVNIAKAVSTWEMADVASTCRERCGAQGIFNVNRISDYILLLQGLITAEGDNQVLLSTVAGQLLAASWPERIPAPQARGRGVPDAAWLGELFLFREQRLWEDLNRRREARADAGYFDAWNAISNEGIEMARLRGIRTALACLHRAAGATDGSVREALRALCGLFGINELRRDAGWYLAHGLLDAEQVLDLPAVADDLCVALRPHIDLLLDGFALAPELLRAPIAADGYIDAFCREAAAQARRDA